MSSGNVYLTSIEQLVHANACNHRFGRLLHGAQRQPMYATAEARLTHLLQV